MDRGKTDLSETMIDASSSILFALDLQGHLLRWNRAAASLTGISEDELRGRLFHETSLFVDNGRHWKREFDRICAARVPGFFESRWRVHDSSLVPVACSCMPVSDASGAVEYIVCTGTRSLSYDFAADRAAEMRGISRYLHDTVSQELVAAAFSVSSLGPAVSSEPLRTDFDSAVCAIDRCCRDVRVLSSVLAAPPLDGTLLDISIEELAAVVRDEAGIPIALDIEPVSGSISDDAQLLLLTVMKCCIARAIGSRAGPSITTRLRSRTDGAHLALEMAPPPPAFQDGWATLRERARALGGSLSIESDSQRAAAFIFLPGFEE